MTNREKYNEYVRSHAETQFRAWEKMSNEEFVKHLNDVKGSHVEIRLYDDLMFFRYKVIGKAPVCTMNEMIEWLKEEYNGEWHD